MILVVVALAYLSIWAVEACTDGGIYYLSSSLVYSAVAVGSFLVWLNAHSRAVFAYVAVNFLAALFNFLISSGTGYDMYAHFYFTVFQPVAAFVELLVLIRGGADVLLFFHSRPCSLVSCRLLRDRDLVEFKTK